MKNLGFDTGVSTTPITPVMLGEAPLAQQFSRELFEEGVFAMANSYPIVPLGKARVRVMLSAAHTKDDLDKGLGNIRQGRERVGGDQVVSYHSSRPVSNYLVPGIDRTIPGTILILITTH